MVSSPIRFARRVTAISSLAFSKSTRSGFGLSLYALTHLKVLLETHTASIVFDVFCHCPSCQDVVKLLLQRGAGLDCRDKDNITALMEASIMDHRDVVKHLLKVIHDDYFLLADDRQAGRRYLPDTCGQGRVCGVNALLGSQDTRHSCFM